MLDRSTVRQCAPEARASGTLLDPQGDFGYDDVEPAVDSAGTPGAGRDTGAGTGRSVGRGTARDTVPGPASRPLQLAVTSDLALIAGTVAAALTGQGFEVEVEPWPEVGDGTAPMAAEEPVDLGLALCDLEAPRAVDVVSALVARRSVPWLVLTESPPGPLWGAALEAGAALVLSSSTSVSDTAAAVRQVISGAVEPGRQDPLIRAWREERRVRTRQEAVLAALSPTERDVLAALYTGISVRGIARARGVAESTVRHQVAAVRRKLGVESQLAAVAIYARAQGDSGAPGAPGAQGAR